MCLVLELRTEVFHSISVSLVNVSLNQTVLSLVLKFIFKVILNHAQAQLNNGVFTCSQDGLYKFQVYSLTKTDSNLFLELYVNDKLVATLWAHTPGEYAAAGNAVILALMNGDFVKVMTRSQYSINMYGTPDEIYTTFTGVQLGSLELSKSLHLNTVTLSILPKKSTGSRMG
jgi:hypothetical protein